ncbi:PIG-L family deacetylase [Streptomonospora sp. S1-112]|uniref:PIG-L family deacetylase n=1 Tax=Streptomonospora mangrovi TaxID=2883123 RepID=A0A9X3SG57_9ACTN|nr:PIG-L family deacetylase [Streptomonospora mangrovi]MDA0563804.1 PIG-L family deacetylase [Streptomonospora mangrovi]
MAATVTHTIVSPHYDDAVFSCGGLLARIGPAARVVTVCGGLPPEGRAASDWDQRCGFATARAAALERRAEDARALAGVGAQAVPLGWLDRPYAEAAPDADALAAALAPLLTGTEVVVPAAIGAHADHVLARDAALRAARAVGAPVRLYADVPYASAGDWTRPEELRDRRLRWRPALEEVARAGFALAPPRPCRLAPEAAAAKIALARMYASQLCGLGAHHPRLMHVRGELATEVYWRAREDAEAAAAPVPEEWLAIADRPGRKEHGGDH